MLSEKVRGKQRAIEPAISDVPSTSTEPPREQPPRKLKVRFTEGVRDLDITIHERDTVRDIKKTIRDGRSELLNRRLRLIYSGQLLSDAVILSSRLVAADRRQSDLNEGSSVKDAFSSLAHPTTWIHCSVGPTINLAEEEEDGQTQTAQIKPVRGFDRLASVGFSQDDIVNFRRQFHSQSSDNFLDRRDFDSEEDYEEQARALEEQWIDSVDNTGSVSLSQSSSSNTAVLQGILVGFFFPLLPLFFMGKPTPPVFWDDGHEYEAPDSVVFSRSTQIGIVVGFLANLFFGLWIFLLDNS